MSKVMNAIQRAAAERELARMTASADAGQPGLWDAAQQVEASIVNWSARAVPGQVLEQAIARCEAEVRDCEQQAADRDAQFKVLHARLAELTQQAAASTWALETHRKRLIELQTCRALSQTVTQAERALASLRAKLHDALQHADVL